jgi:hypothetical protein
MGTDYTYLYSGKPKRCPFGAFVGQNQIEKVGDKRY